MAADRDRYRNHTYSESRDRARAEHASHDMRDARDYVAAFNASR